MKIALLPLLFSFAASPEALKPGDHYRTLKHRNQERSYVVHVPKSYDPKKPTSVVLVFHGATMDGRQMVDFCGLNATADEAGFIAVYPDGQLKTWNAGGLVFNRNDDVGFTGKILDELETVLNVDKKRVYACGLSNGAMMCYRLAAEMSERIAAIAPVAGTLAINNCKPKRPVPVIHFHGTADYLVPLDGPNKNLPRLINFKSVDVTIQTWVKLNGCMAKPETTELPAKKDKLKVTRKAYNNGMKGAEVVLYLINGGGHTWPGMDTAPQFLGKTTMNISANALLWEFFKKHPLK